MYTYIYSYLSILTCMCVDENSKYAVVGEI